VLNHIPLETKESADHAGLMELLRLSHSELALSTKTQVLLWLHNISFHAIMIQEFTDVKELTLEMLTNSSLPKDLLMIDAIHILQDLLDLTDNAIPNAQLLEDKDHSLKFTAKLELLNFSLLTLVRMTNILDKCSRKKDQCIFHSKSLHHSCNTRQEFSESKLENLSSEDTLLNS
jgi:hypothetical protein